MTAVPEEAIRAGLLQLDERPSPFSVYTTPALWTRPHLARSMLTAHLDPTTDRASRRPHLIRATADWLSDNPGLTDKRVCDIGCGPGLYCEEFVKRGASVTGIDFSRTAIDYAKSHSSGEVNYLHADYLVDELPDGFDVVTLISSDYSALSVDQRSLLLSRVRAMLKPGGCFVMDVTSTEVLRTMEEVTAYGDNMMDGFWADTEYYGLHRSYLYSESELILDRYLIIEPHETWQIYNWNQCFTPSAIEKELEASGFTIRTMAGSLWGDDLNQTSRQIGVIAELS